MTELSEESLEAYREVALRDVCRPDHEVQEAILAKRAVLDRHGIGIRFEADAAGRQPVLFDTSELRALVGELLENAAKALASAPDGEVTLTVSGKPGDARWVELQVTDNGPGIPRERREAMFAPDASSHPEGGFGLHRVREIAQRWLADLAIEDSPSGRGVRIRLSLRTLLPHDAVAAGAVPSHPPAPEDA
jgi:signal transduction histidine kinase